MDEFEQAQRDMTPPGVRGWWVKVLDEVDEDRREALLRAKVNKDISHRAISNVLISWGYDVSRDKVSHWRRNVR